MLLADSPHANSLQLLRLDYNDLNPSIEQVLILLSRLTAIQTLRMQACRIKYRNCLRCAEALANSRTIRTWNFVDNVMYKVHLPRLVFVILFYLLKPRLHQIHVAGYKYPTCIRIQVLSMFYSP